MKMRLVSFGHSSVLSSMLQIGIFSCLLSLILLLFANLNEQRKFRDEIDRLVGSRHQIRFESLEVSKIKEQPKIQIGVFITGIGMNYINFTNKLVNTSRKFFLSDPSQYEVKYFIFTNKLPLAPRGNDVTLIFQEKLGWPGDSMYRPEIYLNYTENYLKKAHFDYIFNFDSDIYFNGTVGEEFLGDTVGVWHWMHYNSPREKLPFEPNPESCAYVSPSAGPGIYYTGAVYGGSTSKVLDIWRWMALCTKYAISTKVIPVYHDESMLNRYFLEHPPSVVLTPTYYGCEAGYGDWPALRKIIFLLKDYETVRDI